MNNKIKIILKQTEEKELVLSLQEQHNEDRRKVMEVHQAEITKLRSEMQVLFYTRHSIEPIDFSPLNPTPNSECI